MLQSDFLCILMVAGRISKVAAEDLDLHIWLAKYEREVMADDVPHTAVKTAKFMFDKLWWPVKPKWEILNTTNQ